MVADDSLIVVEVDCIPAMKSTCDANASISGEFIINNLSLLEGSLNKSLHAINQTVGTLPEGSYPLELTSGFFAAITSAVAAFLINFLYWKRVDQHKKLTSRINEYLEILDTFERLASEYWLHSYAKQHHKKNQIKEIYIHHSIVLFNRYTDVICAEINDKNVKNPTQDKLNSFANKIYETATGDDFKSKNRKASPKKVRQILQGCSEVRMYLSGLKN